MPDRVLVDIRCACLWKSHIKKLPKSIICETLLRVTVQVRHYKYIPGVEKGVGRAQTSGCLYPWAICYELYSSLFCLHKRQFKQTKTRKERNKVKYSLVVLARTPRRIESSGSTFPRPYWVRFSSRSRYFFALKSNLYMRQVSFNL